MTNVAAFFCPSFSAGPEINSFPSITGLILIVRDIKLTKGEDLVNPSPKTQRNDYKRDFPGHQNNSMESRASPQRIQSNRTGIHLQEALRSSSQTLQRWRSSDCQWRSSFSNPSSASNNYFCPFLTSCRELTLRRNWNYLLPLIFFEIYYMHSLHCHDLYFLA